MLQFIAVAGGRFKSLNVNSIVYLYLSALISKPFEVSVFVYYTILFESCWPDFFELSLATTITVLVPVSFNYVRSFKYDGKQARNAGVTSRYHLSNIMSDGIFHDPWQYGQSDNLLFIVFAVVVFFVVFLFCFALLLLWYFCFPWKERDGISFMSITPTSREES